MDELDVDNLIPLMPRSVLEEYLLHGDASIFGFSPMVKHWLKTSTHPRVEKWRNDLRRHTAGQIHQALKRQERMNELTNSFSPTNGPIRKVATIDPVLKAWMEVRDRGAFNDPHAIADTKKRHPKIFNH